MLNISIYHAILPIEQDIRVAHSKPAWGKGPLTLPSSVERQRERWFLFNIYIINIYIYIYIFVAICLSIYLYIYLYPRLKDVIIYIYTHTYLHVNTYNIYIIYTSLPCPTSFPGKLPLFWQAIRFRIRPRFYYIADSVQARTTLGWDLTQCATICLIAFNGAGQARCQRSSLLRMF